MCGIFGMMGLGVNQWDVDFLRDLGIVSQLRGRDGAGIYQIKSMRNYNQWDAEDFYKTEDNFSCLLEDVDHMRGAKRILSSQYPDVWMGHVRAATRGVISDDNSHPFKFSKIVGAHNGTLKDYKYIHAKKTDSELMFADMNEKGIDSVLESLDRDSAFTVTIYDKEEKCMYFARNELRTLAMAFNTERAVLYWASELDMLKYVLDRANFEYKSFTINPNVLIKVRVEDIRNQTIDTDPLRCLTFVKKLDRPVPTQIEKAQQARKAYEDKKRAEQEAANDKAAQEAAQQTEAIKTIHPELDDEIPFDVTDNVIHLPPPPKQTEQPAGSRRTREGIFRQKSFYAKCKCGCVTMNMIQSSKAARGLHPHVRYDFQEDQYYCESLGCDPKVSLKENA